MYTRWTTRRHAQPPIRKTFAHMAMHNRTRMIPPSGGSSGKWRERGVDKEDAPKSKFPTLPPKTCNQVRDADSLRANGWERENPIG